MDIKVRASAGGAYADVIQPPAERDGQIVGEPTVVSSTAIAAGEELTLKVPGATDPAQIEVGDVVATPEPSAEESGGDQGGGEEGSPAGGAPAGEGEEAPPTGGEGEGGGAPAEGQGEQPSTSAASEKPLYAIANSDADGFTAPEGFTASGLETPEGTTLFHYSGDSAGQPHTFDVGSVEDVTLYAEADDNEKPVKVPDAEAAPADSASS